jgi:DNA-binding transcriptional MerR regulator
MAIINDHYTVKQLARLAGVSVRTLHYYDQAGLLVPSVRTEANYRLYGEKELLRLQQILFYKELGFSIQQIGDVLNDPDFDVLRSLEEHKVTMLQKQEQLSVLLTTIDKTISKLKGENIMLTNKELYVGFTQEEVELIRNEAINKYGQDAVTRSEHGLKKLTKEDIVALGKEREDIHRKLQALTGRAAEDKEVQEQIERHYQLTRVFWGTKGDVDPQKEAYSGLADLYLADERFTTMNGVFDKELTAFMVEAMKYFSRQLK